MLKDDYTPGGMKLQGKYENDRNEQSRRMFADILKEVYGADQCIVAHHITYVAVEKRDGFEYQIVEEIPSADALIFDHEIAKKIWGERWMSVLEHLAVTPVPERDARMIELYYGRPKNVG